MNRDIKREETQLLIDVAHLLEEEASRLFFPTSMKLSNESLTRNVISTS
jgi:hypothetical protein